MGRLQVCTLAQYGPSRWLSAWNIIDICTYVFQILISIAYFGRCAEAIFVTCEPRTCWMRFDQLMEIMYTAPYLYLYCLHRWQLKSDALSVLSALQACATADLRDAACVMDPHSPKSTLDKPYYCHVGIASELKHLSLVRSAVP